MTTRSSLKNVSVALNPVLFRMSIAVSSSPYVSTIIFSESS